MCWSWERSFTEPSELVTVYSLSEVREVAGSVTNVHTFCHDAHHRTNDFDDGFQGHRRTEGLRDPGSLA